MAKHDQRILKFLNQNADRAPTITEMMTRLNISISDISDSLGSLQSQGLITKKTNNQGIECWFPTGPQASPQQVPPMQVHAPHLATQQMATSQIPVQSAPVENRYREDSRTSTDSRFLAASQERGMQAPEPQPPAPKASPVQVSHIPMAEAVYSLPSQPEPSMNGSAPAYSLAQPSPKGVGFLTLAMGLVLAVGVSTWLGGRMAAKEVKKASTTFVDKKALLEATAAFNDFQEKTKTHVTALEDQVKQLTAQLASSKAAAESLQTASAKPAAPSEAEAKGKGKKTAAVKAKPSLPMAKPAQSTAKAKSKASQSMAATSAIAKAAARGAAKKRRSSSSASGHEGSEYSSTSESGAGSGSGSGSADAAPAPSVPDPPGLEELPPPPSE